MRLRPSTGVYIAIVTMIALFYAGYVENLAALYCAAGFGFIAYLLHVIEVKLSRLLDHYGLVVSRADIARE